MDISTIIIAIILLIVDVFLITIEIKNKLIFEGKNKYKIITPVMVIAFIILTTVSKSFKYQDLIILIEILPLAFIGNKCGITENGLYTKSYVTTWDKIENYSLKEEGNKYILSYKTNLGERKLFFKVEDKEDVKKYLLGIKKLKYARK